MISSDTFAVTISLECNYLMCDRTDWHDIKSAPQHTSHLLIQKVVLPLLVNSRGNDFLWNLRNAFWYSLGSCFFRIAIKLLSFLLLNLGISRFLFLISGEYMFSVTIISISCFTRNHKHEIDNCLYNNSTKFDIIV